MNQNDFIKQYTEVTETLMEYGWLISPFMIGRDFEKIRTLVAKIKQKVNPTEIDKENFSKEISELLTDIIFHPLFRAFFVFRAKEVKYVHEFSHHIERAIFHYYKNDYFSTVLCLLPAVEGVLLSYFGWEFGSTRKPNIQVLIDEIEKCRARTIDNRSYKLYSDTISVFLRKWIFSNTSISDMTFSFLNRHYVLHGMGAQNYYTIADAHRLIMLFDLFIEFISLEQGIWYNFIPENNKAVNDRNTYYFRLIENNICIDEVLNTETSLLKENTNYIVESNIPNWKDMVKRALKDHVEFMKFLDKIRDKKD